MPDITVALGASRAKRFLVYFCGLFLYAFGASLITKAQLGISPVTSVMFIVSTLTGLSLGTATFLVNILIFAIQWVWLGKEFEKKQYLQLAVLFLFSLFVDTTMLLANHFAPASFPGRVAVFIAAILIMAVGISAAAGADLVLPPGDGMAKTIAYKCRMEFGKAKVINDCCLVAITLVISLIAYHEIRVVHVGTLISALCLGTVVRAVTRGMRKAGLLSW